MGGGVEKTKGDPIRGAYEIKWSPSETTQCVCVCVCVERNSTRLVRKQTVTNYYHCFGFNQANQREVFFFFPPIIIEGLMH